MVYEFGREKKDDSVKIRMDITFELPEQMAREVERLGIYEFERCEYNADTRSMTASVTTMLYRKGA